MEEMQQRYLRFKRFRVNSLARYNNHDDVTPEDRLPWKVVVLDEYNDLTASPPEQKSIERELVRVAQKGRAAGLHVIIATQRPTADVINGVIRSNLPARLALRTFNNLESRIIIGEAGAETLAGDGDALVRTVSDVVRIQCAIPSDVVS